MGYYNSNLTKTALAKILKVNSISIKNWEMGKTPVPKMYKRIIEFLDYVPQLKSNTLGDKLFLYRMERGITQNEMAFELKIDRGAISQIEQDRVVLLRYIKVVENILENA